jgi:hypothetical protein
VQARSTTDTTANTTEAPDPCQPLAGVRVADFTDTIPGPLATEVLAQLGADVIKVGSPARASSTRQLPVLDYLNNGKRTISLDLKSSHGRAAALALVEKSDVLATAAEALVDEAFTRPRPGEAGAALLLGVEVRVGQPLGASGADTAGVLAELSCSEAVRSACLADVAGQPSAS